MIYDEIWQADMKGNGVVPLIKGVSDQEKNQDQGYVIVNMNPFPEEHRDRNRERRNRHGRNRGNHDHRHDEIRSERSEVNVLEEVHIPESKAKSYELFKALHDNYDWRRERNDETPQKEMDEVNALIDFAIQTEPLKIARKYAVEKGAIENNASDEKWKEKLKYIWFDQYKNNSTSTFEHVFIGEAGPTKHGHTSLSGHHSWYHYFINDGPYDITHQEDKIYFMDFAQVINKEKSKKAEVITIRYDYIASDAEGSETLHKQTGGFFVGLSTEGLMAMGTVAFLDGREGNNEPIPFIINDENYHFTVYKLKEDHDRARTFFPVIEKQRELAPV